MATLNNMAIVFVHADLLVRHQSLAGSLRKGVINAALRVTCMQVRKQQLELNMEQQTGSK